MTFTGNLEFESISPRIAAVRIQNGMGIEWKNSWRSSDIRRPNSVCRLRTTFCAFFSLSLTPHTNRLLGTTHSTNTCITRSHAHSLSLSVCRLGLLSATVGNSKKRSNTQWNAYMTVGVCVLVSACVFHTQHCKRGERKRRAKIKHTQPSNRHSRASRSSKKKRNKRRKKKLYIYIIRSAVEVMNNNTIIVFLSS